MISSRRLKLRPGRTAALLELLRRPATGNDQPLRRSCTYSHLGNARHGGFDRMRANPADLRSETQPGADSMDV